MLKTNNHIYKNIETYPCKNCGQLFKRRTKMRTGRRTQPGIRGKGCVTCSRKCSRQYVRLGNIIEKRKKEQAHKKKLEKLKKMGIITVDRKVKDKNL